MNACFAILHFKIGQVVSFCKVCTIQLLETLRSENGDIHENVAEKKKSHPLKLFCSYPKSPCYLKEGNLGLEVKTCTVPMPKFRQRW